MCFHIFGCRDWLHNCSFATSKKITAPELRKGGYPFYLGFRRNSDALCFYLYYTPVCQYMQEGAARLYFLCLPRSFFGFISYFPPMSAIQACNPYFFCMDITCHKSYWPSNVCSDDGLTDPESFFIGAQ
jgi:hypothetical protein